MNSAILYATEVHGLVAAVARYVVDAPIAVFHTQLGATTCVVLMQNLPTYLYWQVLSNRMLMKDSCCTGVNVQTHSLCTYDLVMGPRWGIFHRPLRASMHLPKI